MDLLGPNPDIERRMEEISKKKGIYDPSLNGVTIKPLTPEELERKRAELAAMTPEQKKNVFEFDNGDYVDYNKPPDTAFAAELEADEEGYKPITWTQLKRSFCYERPAHGFKLHGDISQKPQEHWERSKHIKIRDNDGCEGAIFFYDDNYDFDQINVGNRITVKSPRLHRFMDGQEGMRVENCKQNIAKVQKERFSDAKRLDYGELNKRNGNRHFENKRYDEALASYDAAIKHLEGTFHEQPEDEQKGKELVAACYLNIAAVHIAERKWKAAEFACNKALKVNATPQQNAKAYFRIGQAAIELGELSIANEALSKAHKLAPGDPRVIQEMTRLAQAVQDQKEAEKTLFRKEREANKKEFGLKRRLLTAVPTELDKVCNFRDLGGLPVGSEDGKRRLRRHLLYRSSNFSLASAADVKTLVDDFGMKTILDFRNNNETRNAKKIAKKINAKPNEFADFHDTFVPVSVTCGKTVDAPVKLKVTKVKGKTDAEVLQKRVVFNIDLVTKTVMAIVSWWVWVIVMLLGAVLQIRLAARVIIHFTAVKVGPLGLYKLMLKHQKAELRKALDIICDESNYPLAISCSMGKDRTGVVTALALSLAGVPDSYVALDYAKSTPQLSKALIAAQRDLGMGKEWEVCDVQTMIDLLAHIREQYGSVEKYAVNELGLPLSKVEELRRFLVVDSESY